MNKVDKAHDKLINIWEWLDKLDDKNEPTYLAIRDGLKHIVMSTLCHVLFNMNRVQCQQVRQNYSISMKKSKLLCSTYKLRTHYVSIQ